MRSNRTDRRGPLRTLALVALAGLLTAAFALPGRVAEPQEQAGPYSEKVGMMITLEMMPVPGGSVQMSSGSERVAAFWMMKTEVPWDAYDVYVFSLDRMSGVNGAVDAVARPSKPYVLPGDQFGHSGLPALGMTYQAAENFAKWISAHTGRKYRLPTEAEWERACRAGANEATVDAAWFRDNAGRRTHKLATRAADALGIHDLLGNAGEWVLGADGPVLKGGAWNSPGGEASCSARLKQTPAWQATDPNLPKSTWWLSDAPFVGFRLIREP